MTYERVRDSFGDSASVVSAMAQRGWPEEYVNGSWVVHGLINCPEYWERLASSVNFPGKTLQQCLEVIHTDIVRVWRFDDPEGYLSSTSFKAMISNIVINGEEGNAQTGIGPNKKLCSASSQAGISRAAGVSLVAGIAGIVTSLSGPAAPIVIPIAAAFVMAKWVYDIYSETTAVLRLLMSYIIDLTLIMQNLFWLQALTNYKHPLSRKIIKAAAKAYQESNIKQSLAFHIDKHLEQVSFHLGPDATLSTIVKLIESNIIDSAEMLDKRSRFPVLEDMVADEAWEADATEMDT
ncbi:hypothetical protein H0H92_013836 [Tricholoma furcatifolium]|nr:hypothetical protein H0H92_013836 [Tricholoma furcatifolium]